jgi:uncharacterized protein (DUF983 family)
MKGTKIYSIFKLKCPKCHEGEFFESHFYHLKKLGHVLEECPNCKASYVPEPGFYFGAMYVSYALGVALFVSIWARANWFFEEVSVGLQITLVIGSIVLLGPFIYAFSKIIWANMFIHYKENEAK